MKPQKNFAHQPLFWKGSWNRHKINVTLFFKLLVMKNIKFLVCIYLFVFLANAQQKKANLFVGTYTKSCDSKGIYVYEFDPKTGKCVFKTSTENVINPSYLSISEDKKTIFSVNENGDKSQVTSFDFDKSLGKLTLKNSFVEVGADPCFIINDDKNVITANYSGGSISVFEKRDDGSIGILKQTAKHEGGSVNLKRQTSPHVHMVQFSIDKKFVLAADLGTDKIYVYDYFSESINEVLKLKSTISLKKGSGPRHFAFASNGKTMYVLNELTGTISFLELLGGEFKSQKEYSVLAKNYKDEPRAADIKISADNKFLYASNRESANDISVFRIIKNGRLAFLQRVSTIGNGPRNFTIDPSGKWLLVGNQKTNEIVIFRRNQKTGLITDSGNRVAVCAPVCLVFE
jgi:6-phosphogluconolactonase